MCADLSCMLNLTYLLAQKIKNIYHRYFAGVLDEKKMEQDYHKG